MASDTVEERVAELRRRGVRITAPRRAVVDALVAAGSHVTAEDLHTLVRAHHPDVSQSSIYRTLGLLADVGMVHHVHLGHGPAEYHLVDDAHTHLVCSVCGTVTEIDTTITEPFAAGIADRFGFEVDLRHFALTGRCSDCRARGWPAMTDCPWHPRSPAEEI